MPECKTFKLKMRFEYFSASDSPDPFAILCAIALANCTCAHLCLQLWASCHAYFAHFHLSTSARGENNLKF